jgi:peptidyl-prolyl cis-trans isomerase SurA
MHKNSTFVLVFLLSVILCSFQASYAAILLDRVVAVVNKEVITWSELYKMMDNEASDQMKALKEEDRAKVYKKNEAVFLDKLIDFRLQLQEARRIGMSVSPDEVKEAIENIKKKYSINDKLFEESLKKEGLSLEEYKKSLSDQILVSQFINREIKNKIVVSEKDVNQYIAANKISADDNETFKLRQIFFKKPKDDADKKAVEEKADLVQQKLKAGEDFSKLAAEYSEDPSGRSGGDLGYVKKDLLAKEFIDVLVKMKAGDVSQPFWTDSGLHIIKLEEREAPKTEEELRETVKNNLSGEQFAEKYKGLIKDLRQKAYIEIRL